MLRVLCEGGAKVDALNARGETPLHDAVSRGSEELVRRLLEYGADPRRRSEKTGKDAYTLAEKFPPILQTLSRHNITQELRRAESVDSLADVSSITSLPLSPIGNDRLTTRERYVLAQEHPLEHWTNLLWPQPQSLTLHGDQEVFTMPADGKLRISFAPGSSPELVRAGMQLWTSYVPELGTRGVALEWGQLMEAPSPIMGDQEVFTMPADGKLRISFAPGSSPELVRAGMQLWTYYVPELGTRGVALEWGQLMEAPSPIMTEGESHVLLPGVRLSLVGGVFARPESYSLSIRPTGIEIAASDLAGLKHAILTTVQAIRASGEPGKMVRVGCLSIRDWPDTRYRSVLLDFTGIRILAIDSLCALASRLSYIKANQLVVHLEVRPSDRFSLPYSPKELFHLRQVCADLSLSLVPSLDLNARNVEADVAGRILDDFLNAFPATASLHFGDNLSPVMAACPELMQKAHRFGTDGGAVLFLSFESLGVALEFGHQLPPYAVVCLPAESLLPEPAQTQLIKAGNIGGGVCIRFGTSDVGFLTQSPENLVRNAVLAAKLPSRYPGIIGTMVCDLASGCEIVPASLASLPESAVLGAAWNRDVDWRKYSALLPHIAAEHFLLDRHMVALFRQMILLGYLEHELTKLAVGPGENKALGGLSVFVNLLLNPDALMLERLSPVSFKQRVMQEFEKSRIQLQKSLRDLGEARKTMSYRYELALTLAEIQLLTDLMILSCRMGQALCLHGSNPEHKQNGVHGFPVINVGVANLPLTTRTDLANALLELRSRFQHTWLSRNVALSLPNALKLFDNLFRTLLPPNMQKLGDTLL